MKLAYFSPMPPARTGVATYSSQLAKALSRHCELTVFTPTADAAPLDGVRLVKFVEHGGVLKTLNTFDQFLYHLGNNPWFHLDIRKVLSLFPGPTCLHDTVLYYLAASLGRGAILKELMLENRETAFESVRTIEAESADGDLLRYLTPSRHPCLRGVLREIPHVIVHSLASARIVKEIGYGGPIDVVPHLHYATDFPAVSEGAARALRRQLGYDDSDFVIGTFGFIGPTKRLDKVLEAIAGLRQERLGKRLRLLIVGEGESLDEPISRFGLQDLVQRAGFVTDEDFRRYMSVVDAIVNLRFPSHGESSGSLIQAMSYGKACIVTDHGSCSELPDETLIKVPYDEREVPTLMDRIRALAEDQEALSTVGEAARSYIAREHDPDQVARTLLSHLGRTQRTQEGPFDPLTYIHQRIERALPPAN